ncbi:TatD family hydrolase [Mycobacterium sp. WUMAC-067]|uniref:TatD family hydrolase n=1 Tax=unclassified Mycobacterium TaxID=2642494 RepID=UPI001E05CE6A|nr:TatD family hydrolase [Mycobacterium sp. WUMAC-067]MCA2316010.1 TatD family hydrolase [Mycobacterium sp. WUMAC-025]
MAAHDARSTRPSAVGVHAGAVWMIRCRRLGQFSGRQSGELMKCRFAALKEGAYANRTQLAGRSNLLWGLGTHPGVEKSLAQFDTTSFCKLLPSFALVGEVGLDRRGHPIQTEVFREILSAVANQPVILSVHSAGMCSAVLDEIERSPHPGIVLHWFNGTAADIRRAVEMHCFFSVNAAMKHHVLEQIPMDKTLTETDFPSSMSRTRARRPGDVSAIESVLEQIHGGVARDHSWRNFSDLVARSGVRDRLPPTIRDALCD